MVYATFVVIKVPLEGDGFDRKEKEKKAIEKFTKETTIHDGGDKEELRLDMLFKRTTHACARERWTALNETKLINHDY